MHAPRSHRQAVEDLRQAACESGTRFARAEWSGRRQAEPNRAPAHSQSGHPTFGQRVHVSHE